MRFDTSVTSELLEGLRQAKQTIGRAGLVVLPTDTVYGIGCDAFSAFAVEALLKAKGRGRQSPPPVLMPSAATIDGLAQNIPAEVRALADAFWPGGLTIVLEAQPSLAWDLGDTNGTVAVRVPAHPVALELLAETGPLAVSSANLTGEPAATTAAGAHDQLGARMRRYSTLGLARQEPTTAFVAIARRRAKQGAAVHHRRRVAAFVTRRIGGANFAGQSRRFQRGQDQNRKAACQRRCGAFVRSARRSGAQL